MQVKDGVAGNAIVGKSGRVGGKWSVAKGKNGRNGAGADSATRAGRWSKSQGRVVGLLGEARVG